MDTLENYIYNDDKWADYTRDECNSILFHRYCILAKESYAICDYPEWLHNLHKFHYHV